MPGQVLGTQRVYREEQSRDGTEGEPYQVQGPGIGDHTSTQDAPYEGDDHGHTLHNGHPLTEQRNGGDDHDERRQILQHRRERQGYPGHGAHIAHGVHRRPQDTYYQDYCDRPLVDVQLVPVEKKKEKSEDYGYDDVTETGYLHGCYSVIIQTTDEQSEESPGDSGDESRRDTEVPISCVHRGLKP